jgi:hypothetical protein
MPIACLYSPSSMHRWKMFSMMACRRGSTASLPSASSARRAMYRSIAFAARARQTASARCRQNILTDYGLDILLGAAGADLVGKGLTGAEGKGERVVVLAERVVDLAREKRGGIASGAR